MPELKDSLEKIALQSKDAGNSAAFAYSVSSLPPTGMLSYVERLAKEGVIGLDESIRIIKANPILEDETRQLFDESKRTLKEHYGIEVPEYSLIFSSSVNECISSADFSNGEANLILRKIILPEQSLLNVYITGSHEQAHAYNFENSQLCTIIKSAALQGDRFAARSMSKEGQFILEGWASFIEEACAKIRAQKIGCDLHQRCYERIRSSEYDWRRKNQPLHKNILKYNGAEFFNKIFEKKGFESAKYAANNLITNEQLKEFADSC